MEIQTTSVSCSVDQVHQDGRHGRLDGCRNQWVRRTRIGQLQTQRGDYPICHGHIVVYRNESTPTRPFRGRVDVLLMFNQNLGGQLCPTRNFPMQATLIFIRVDLHEC